MINNQENNPVNPLLTLFKKRSLKKVTWLLLILTSLFIVSGTIYAADDLSMSALTLTTNADGSQEYSVTLQILIFMTALGFIPAALIMMTSFTASSFWSTTNPF